MITFIAFALFLLMAGSATAMANEIPTCTRMMVVIAELAMSGVFFLIFIERFFGVDFTWFDAGYM